MLTTLTDALLPRLTEPSTWVGAISLVLNAVGWGTLSPDIAGPLSAVLAGATSLVLVAIREARKPKVPA